jgi:hypothetical protein
MLGLANAGDGVCAELNGALGDAFGDAFGRA